MFCATHSSSVLSVPSVVKLFLQRGLYPQIAQIPLIGDGFRHIPSSSIREICVGNVDSSSELESYALVAMGMNGAKRLDAAVVSQCL